MSLQNKTKKNFLCVHVVYYYGENVKYRSRVVGKKKKKSLMYTQNLNATLKKNNKKYKYGKKNYMIKKR